MMVVGDILVYSDEKNCSMTFAFMAFCAQISYPLKSIVPVLSRIDHFESKRQNLSMMGANVF